jgi:squalene synthase HpnC
MATLLEDTSSADAATPPFGLPGEEVLAKARAENFPVALRLLPRRVRAALHAVYGFARLVDDTGDLAPGDRLGLLDWIEHDLERAYEGRARHPLLRRLTPVVREHRLPQEPFRRLIEANRVDQAKTRYESFDELVAYCHLSADPVGELVLRIFGVATPERLHRSDRVCTALQLAEHWQDVGEDLARGRLYLPLEDLRRFGVAEEDLQPGAPTERVRRLLAFEVERARGLLADGVPLVTSLRGRARLAVAAYVAGGRSALAAIERSGFNVLESIPRATRGARLRDLARVLREAR